MFDNFFFKKTKMQTSELNLLLNKILNVSETNISIENYSKKFIDLIGNANDEIINYTFLYFFPYENSSEQNSTVFWFEKYRDTKNYTEYNFSLDLLKLFGKYKESRSADEFYSGIKIIIEKFGEYKNIRYLINLVKLYANEFKWIVAYLTKDYFYFGFLNEKNEITEINWINKVERNVNQTILPILVNSNIQLTQKVNEITEAKLIQDRKITEMTNQKLQQDKKITEINNEKLLLEKKINEISSSFLELRTKNKSFEDRINKIELRDTIKITIKYLYYVLHAKFNFKKKRNIIILLRLKK